jgi:hypothetical protein
MIIIVPRSGSAAIQKHGHSARKLNGCACVTPSCEGDALPYSLHPSGHLRCASSPSFSLWCLGCRRSTLRH